MQDKVGDRGRFLVSFFDKAKLFVEKGDTEPSPVPFNLEFSSSSAVDTSAGGHVDAATAAATAAGRPVITAAGICFPVDDASGDRFTDKVIPVATHTGTACIEVVGCTDGHPALAAGDHTAGDGAAAGKGSDQADQNAHQTHTGPFAEISSHVITDTF